MTESDLIKLPAALPAGGDIHGFYRTSEGRSFLRQLYLVFVELIPFGERKIASIITDESHLDQDQEIELTRAALKRWREGQKDLWSKDATKTLRVMARLEGEMMSVADLREILDDQAADIHKGDIGRSLAIFFYGANRSRTSVTALYASIANFEGLFVKFKEHVDDGGEISFWRSDEFCYFKRVEGEDYLISHDFMIRDKNDVQNPVLIKRLSGFAYPMKDGDVHRFMIDYENPSSRVLDAFSPHFERHAYLRLTSRYGGEIFWHTRRVRNTLDVDLELNAERYSGSETVILQRDTSERGRFISKIIESHLWDIVI